jgi:hypothetical protein
MNNRKDLIAPEEQVYLGTPIREERSLIDEILKQDVFNQTSSTDPNGKYRQIEQLIYDYNTALVVGDKRGQITSPFDATLVAVHGRVDTPSTANSVRVSLTDRNGDDILAGWIEIDANEYGSDTGAYQPAINTNLKNFIRYDLININVDAIGTGTKGLIVTLYFIVDKFYFG